MKAVKTPGLAATPCDIHPRGAYEIRRADNGQPLAFWFVCPGCGTTSALALRPSPAPQSWAFDGNDDAPTLKPSINHVGCWHGWLTAGEFHE